MNEARLDEFLKGSRVDGPRLVEVTETKQRERETLRKLLSAKLETPKDLPECFLLSAGYDGDRAVAVLKLYEPQTGKMYLWTDNTDHKPYCLTNLSKEELEKIPEVAKHEGLERFDEVKKFHPLLDREISITKIIAKDPLSIGGRPAGSIRDLIPAAKPSEVGVRVWEADIKYYQNYLYDNTLEVGMPYRVENGRLVPVEYSIPPDVMQRIEQMFAGETPEFLGAVERWMRLMESPLPNLRYAALDIEVAAPTNDRVPEPSEAAYPIICASTVASDGRKRVLLLKRREVADEKFPFGPSVSLEFYDSEFDLVAELLRLPVEYPILVTFNGDEFDFRYIYHRAQKLGFQPSEIPIELGREFTTLRNGVHIDLYRFFFSRSIQVYAFDQKYREVTLQDVATALLGVGKIILERGVQELPYAKLAEYCLRDSELTYNLAAMDDHLIMKLIISISRVSTVPMEDATRQGVSNWIRSMMFFEHRRRNMLIPTRAEIEAEKSIHATEAIIKGKKYRGGIVIEPKMGVNFNVAVLDFASLYPSIINRYNLSYETVLCRHEECRSNVVPGTPHWVCTRQQGLSSLLIGSLRELRVKWYKAKAKDRTFSKEKRSWYSVVQRTLKVILNASYGVFGAEHFSLFCLPLAEATAAAGRHAITATIAKAQELGIEVLYGDTDSVFLRQPSEDQVNRLVEWSRQTLGMELDVDKLYRYAVFSKRKKNYVGVYPDGSVDIKGLTGKKRNTPEFLKKAFTEMVTILSAVQNEADFFTAKQKIKTIVKDCYLKLKAKAFTLDELAFTVVLGKDLTEYDKTTPQHVKALRQMSEDERREFGAGSIIRFVKVRREPGVKLCHMANSDDVDTLKYVEHIRATFEQVLEALDIEFNDIIGVSRLESFMQ